MTPRERFSNRRGFRPPPTEITVREDAPSELREAILQIAVDSGISPGPQRTILCRLLHVLPSDHNWSEYPNIWREIQGLIAGCPWYVVYDYIEALWDELSRSGSPARAAAFTETVNQYFLENGIGWQLVNGVIEIRGPEAFESALQAAAETAGGAFQTAARELHEARLDLSRRPEPDLTGAIHHTFAAVECVAREITGDANATFGTILARNPGLLPRPLDTAAEKIWGFASDQGRHLKEGRALRTDEVELVVGLAAQLVTFLVKRFRPSGTAV